jgi:alanine dehydrogenase
VAKRLFILIVVSVGALAVTASALAGGGTALSGYGGAAGVAQAKVVHTGGGLPFTGLNLAFIALGAAALVVSGLMLRRNSRTAR